MKNSVYYNEFPSRCKEEIQRRVYFFLHLLHVVHGESFALAGGPRKQRDRSGRENVAVGQS